MYCDEASILPSSPLAPLFAHRALRNRDAQKQLATGYFKYIRSYLSETNAIRTERRFIFPRMLRMKLINARDEIYWIRDIIV